MIRFKIIAPRQDLAHDDYLGLGLQKGMLHLVWDLGWFSRSEFTVPRPDLNDGRWHKIEVDRVRQSLELRVDGEVFGSQGRWQKRPQLVTRQFCHIYKMILLGCVFSLLSLG